MPRPVWSIMSAFVLQEVKLWEINQTYTHSPPLPYLAFTAHLVALAEALLLGVAQGVPGHDVITQGHVHAPASLGLACKNTRQR